MSKRINEKGISLIVLVITIIVVIILAGAVIMVITGNNPIDMARKATFENNVSQYSHELSLWITTEYSNRNGDFDASKLYADSGTVEYDGQYIDDLGSIKDILSSMTDNDKEKFKIKDGELRYIDSNDDKEYEWAQEIGIVKTINSTSKVWQFDSSTQTITGYDGDDLNRLTTITIPNQIDGVEVKKVEGQPVYSSSLGDMSTNTSIKNLVISSGIEEIGSYAFNCCRNVENITIPDSVTKIGPGAFMQCEKLKSISLPTGIVQVDGDVLFCNCYALETIQLPSCITSIGQNMFSNCKTLQSLIIPDNVTKIENSAFSGCGNLSSITFSNNIENIDQSAFYKCSKITSLVLPDSVKDLGLGAFKACTGLTQITIKNKIETMGYNVFYGCSTLANITINKANGSIQGSPWGAPSNPTVTWNI